MTHNVAAVATFRLRFLLGHFVNFLFYQLPTKKTNFVRHNLCITFKTPKLAFILNELRQYAAFSKCKAHGLTKQSCCRILISLSIVLGRAQVLEPPSPRARTLLGTSSSPSPSSPPTTTSRQTPSTGSGTASIYISLMRSSLINYYFLTLRHAINLLLSTIETA